MSRTNSHPSYVDDDDDDHNPFRALASDDFFAAEIVQTSTQRSRCTSRPDWGIPTFQEQCNGVNSFTLCQRDELGQRTCCKGSSNKDSCSCCSVTVTLEHRRHSTGSDLWEAALVLAHALNRPIPHKSCTTGSRNDSFKGATIATTVSTTSATLWQNAQTVLELGSGTGALGLYAAHVLGARNVVLTDLLPNLDLLATNRELNASKVTKATEPTMVHVTALDWNDCELPNDLVDWYKMHAASGIDLILGSDLFLPYAVHLLDPLARTLRDLLHQLGHDDTCAILAYEERFDCSAFYESATKYNLHVEHIDNDWLHPIYQDPGRIHVLRIRVAERI